MMDRRKVLRALFGSAIAAITMRTGTDAQQAVKVWRIGVVGLGPPTPEINDALAAFRRVLTEHGHQVTVEYRWPEPDPLLNLADEIIAFRFDVLVFWGERALRTLPKRSELLSPPPTVFALYNELRPHDVLWQFSIDRGIAGVSATRPTLIPDQVRILKDVVPSMSRLAILWDQSDPGSLRAFNEAVAEANAVGVRPQGVEGRNTTQLESAFGAAVSGGANALIVIASATSISHATTVVALAARYRLPAIYSLHEFVEVGGLISYGASFRETLRRAAAYVDRIVKGGNWPPVRPRGTLPIEPSPKLEFVVNRKTAKALGGSPFRRRCWRARIRSSNKSRQVISRPVLRFPILGGRRRRLQIRRPHLSFMAYEDGGAARVSAKAVHRPWTRGNPRPAAAQQCGGPTKESYSRSRSWS